MKDGSDVTRDERIASSLVLTDGAWGTELQARGLAPAALPDLWNLAHPERVEAVARAYVDAGSRIILTNPFRANRVALAAHGAADSVDGRTVYAVTAEQFASHVPALIAAGARFIGGCCGTTPAFVAALHQHFAIHQQAQSPSRGASPPSLLRPR